MKNDDLARAAKAVEPLAAWFRERGWYLKGVSGILIPGEGRVEGLQLDKLKDSGKGQDRLVARVTAVDRGTDWVLYDQERRRYGRIDKAGCPEI